MFWMNTSLGSTPNSSFMSSGRDSLRARYSSMNSQPSIRSFFTCFWIFGAFRHMPSAMTRHAPPRIRFVSIRGRSRNPLISASSVPSPLIPTGQWATMSAISSSDGVYWRCWACL